jgi:hypothetical protein
MPIIQFGLPSFKIASGHLAALIGGSGAAPSLPSVTER